MKHLDITQNLLKRQTLIGCWIPCLLSRSELQPALRGLGRVLKCALGLVFWFLGSNMQVRAQDIPSHESNSTDQILFVRVTSARDKCPPFMIRIVRPTSIYLQSARTTHACNTISTALAHYSIQCVHYF